LLNVLEHPKFVAGNVNTYFIDENPHLFNFLPSMNRAQKLLNYVGGVLINGPMTPFGTNVMPIKVTPTVPEVPRSEWLLVFHSFVVFANIFSRSLTKFR
jgi:pyruvate carboxylase